MAEIYDENQNPIEAYDEEGNPIDVFNEKEVEEKFSEKTEEIKTETEEKFEEKKTEMEEKIEGLETQLKEKDEELKKEGGKPENFKKLRESRDELKDKLTEATTELDKFKEETGKKIEGIEQKVSSKKIDDAIKEVIGDDKELADKVRVHFSRLKPVDETDPVKIEEDFKDRIKSAHILATGGVPADVVKGVAGTGGSYIPEPSEETIAGTPSEEMKEMGLKKMGLTEKDFKAHKKSKE